MSRCKHANERTVGHGSDRLVCALPEFWVNTVANEQSEAPRRPPRLRLERRGAAPDHRAPLEIARQAAIRLAAKPSDSLPPLQGLLALDPYGSRFYGWAY